MNKGISSLLMAAFLTIISLTQSTSNFTIQYTVDYCNNSINQQYHCSLISSPCIHYSGGPFKNVLYACYHPNIVNLSEYPRTATFYTKGKTDPQRCFCMRTDDNLKSGHLWGPYCPYAMNGYSEEQLCSFIKKDDNDDKKDDDDKNKDTQEGIGAAVIVGIVAGVLALIGGVGVIGMHFYKKKKLAQISTYSQMQEN